ncbi:hypothetical protein E4K67_23435 [Desulfosporosinus fructosivorans]|uniref:Uncharacterized protein n=1 Tax=Desulfosporosinus fructosivorans TaxID=2018669 RepID=A0A4Z0QY70_9FIRM|nr:hypothetical protein [Desulfosporosinus fructosivorans]TGE35722.1 hypothetical protein E4K67_23435 [Desulfosporosinus fructosivorans]
MTASESAVATVMSENDNKAFELSDAEMDLKEETVMNEEIKNEALELTDEEIEKAAGGAQSKETVEKCDRCHRYFENSDFSYICTHCHHQKYYPNWILCNTCNISYPFHLYKCPKCNLGKM